VIAASVELMVRANQFDGLVMLCNCDKIVPGMLMAAARLDLPTVFVTGGPMTPGRLGKREIITSDVKEGMGRLAAGAISAREFRAIELHACPGPGACAFMGTANTMACVTEILGLSLSGCARLPAWSGSKPLPRSCSNSGQTTAMGCWISSILLKCGFIRIIMPMMTASRS
jgi:dihydroxy-acid dehydratase